MRMSHLARTTATARNCRKATWIVDLDSPVTLIDGHLAAEFGYQDVGPATHLFVTPQPFPIGLRLDGRCMATR